MPEASREMRKDRAIRRLRWVVLAAALAVVAGVTGLYFAGRGGPPEPPPDPGTDDLEPTGELVTVGEGFERTFSEGDRPVFTVRGERYAVDRSGIVLLEEVEVVVFQEDGPSYRIQGEEARFDVEKREGRLSGGVHLAVPGELELETEALRVTHKGRQVRSTTDVRFRLGEAYEGEARGLRAWLVPRQFLLEHYVLVESLPEAEIRLKLEAAGLFLDRGRSLMRSEGWAVLSRGGERLTASRLHVFFADDEQTLRFVRGQGNVTGLLAAGGVLEEGELAGEGAAAGRRRVAIRADRATLLFTEDGRHPQRMDLEGGPEGRASLRTVGPVGAPHHRLTAPRITGWFDAGVPNRAEAGGGVVLAVEEPGEAEEEEGAGTASRRATGLEGVATFDAEGALAEVELQGDVELTDGALEAAGERGVFDVREDAGELFGRPAVVVTDRGTMEAPRVRYTRADGIAHGTGGVRARLDDAEDSALGGTPLGSDPKGGGGPLRVEAEEGFFRDQPRAFLFRRRVRAWRGDDLLLADELRGDEDEGRVTATGGVRTLFTPEERTGDGKEAGFAAPLEVEAEELVYRRRERLLHYTGDVVAKQEGRTVTCREMDVELAEEGGIARVVSTGDVRVVEPEEGRTLEGQRAVYRPDERTIVVEAAEGAKVTLRDRQGNVLEGPRMEYDLESDQVRVMGRRGEGEAPAAARTAPVEPPDGGDP